MPGPMLDGSMMNGIMRLCMIGPTLFGLVITIVIIVQAVLRARVLGELAQLNQDRFGPCPTTEAPAEQLTLREEP